MKTSQQTKRILIVDDEPNVVTYLEMLLRDNGYETVSASNGAEALESVRGEKPDLVTLDISMPETSGVRFFKELKGDPRTADIPVVVVTAVTGYAGDPYGYMKFMQKQSNLTEPDAFFPKPIDKEPFLDKIQTLLS
jgi:CheY-like chemotaxis protein